MRTIKLRGVDLYTGKYVYAELGEISAENVAGDDYLIFITDEMHTVAPATVTMRVGYDANGNEVYEGDVLVLEHDGNIFEYTAHLKAFATADNGYYIADFSKLKLKEVA